MQPKPGAVGWLVPDFGTLSLISTLLNTHSYIFPLEGFFSWPEPILTGYKGVLRNIERVEKDLKWKDKTPKLVSYRMFTCKSNSRADTQLCDSSGAAHSSPRSAKLCAKRRKAARGATSGASSGRKREKAASHCGITADTSTLRMRRATREPTRVVRGTFAARCQCPRPRLTQLLAQVSNTSSIATASLYPTSCIGTSTSTLHSTRTRSVLSHPSRSPATLT